jgi:outer membrane protein
MINMLDDKMVMKAKCFMAFMWCFVSSVLSQTNWSLEDCWRYAEDNHVSIKLKQLDIQGAENNKKQTNLNYLPSLNGGITHGYNWGQSIDPFTNQFASNRVQTNNFYVSSHWSIFKGLQNYHIQKKIASDVQYQKYNLEVERRNLKIDIAAAYLQVVLNYSVFQIISEQFELSVYQRNRMRELVKLSYSTQNDFLEITAQTALDSARVIQSQNEYTLSLLQLKQLLNLQIEEEFTIQLSGFAESNSFLITTPNYSELAELKAIELRQQMSNLGLKIAQGKLSPTLNLHAAMGSGYSGNNQEFVGNQLQPKPFPTQLEENFYQTAALSLSIPIFNNWSVGAEIQRAKIEMERTRLEKIELTQDLTYKIERLQIELVNIKGNIEAMKIAVRSAEAAFESATLKYENGYIKFTEFLEVKNKLYSTRNELTQLKVELLFKQTVLILYS